MPVFRVYMRVCMCACVCVHLNVFDIRSERNSSQNDAEQVESILKK